MEHDFKNCTYCKKGIPHYSNEGLIAGKAEPQADGISYYPGVKELLASTEEETHTLEIIACTKCESTLDFCSCNKEAETLPKPSRYAGNKLEYWDAARDLGWDYFQATIGKYIHRFRKKHGPEDLCKAINFTVKLLANETGADYYELMKMTPEELGKRFKK